MIVYFVCKFIYLYDCKQQKKKALQNKIKQKMYKHLKKII